MTTENNERNFRILNTLNSVSNDLNSIRDDIKGFINARYTKNNLKHLTASEIQYVVKFFIKNTLSNLTKDTSYYFDEYFKQENTKYSTDTQHLLWAYFVYYVTLNPLLNVKITNDSVHVFEIVDKVKQELPKYQYETYNGFYYILKDNTKIKEIVNGIECNLLFDTVEQVKQYIEQLRVQDEKENKETQT